ncbi:MAG: type 2 lanthipeptide synthetase LanM family protein [Vicinamibacterales bacterium]
MTERLESARRTIVADPSNFPSDAVGLQYLELWNRAFAPGDRAAFLRRLAWDGVTLEHAVVALSNVHAPSRDSDAWVEGVDRLMEDLRPAPVIDAGVPFAEIWAALAQTGWRQLERRRPSAGAELGRAGVDATLGQLARELARVGALTVLEAFRRDVTGMTAGAAHYQEFVRLTLQDRCARLGQTYPVWLRQSLVLIDSWVNASEELLVRLDADRPALEEAFGVPATSIVEVEPGLSDPHHGRRRVTRLVFESGLRLVYKPRSVGGERALYELIAWLAARGVDPSLTRVPTIDRGCYGWMADVEHEPFHSREQVQEYYRRAGALLCLMHVLRGRDLHWENIIATRSGPVVVDAELLLQPAAEGETTPSPLATGLLSCLQTCPDGELVDVGGFRGDRIERGPTAERVWAGLGTSAIDVAEQFLPIGPRANRVVLDGAVQDPEAYADAFVAGFSRMYRGLLAERDALLAPGGPVASLRAVRTRVLVRPSHQYAAALHALADPRFQQDGRRWGCALEALNRRYKFSTVVPRTWCVVGAERDALERLDVPAFWTAADGTDVLDDDRIIAPAFFPQSGLRAVEVLVRQLSEDDLARQASVIRRALGQSRRSRFSTPLEIPAGEAGVRDHRAALVATAEWIARELAGRSVPAGDPSSLTSLCLYDGSAGPALFFAAMAAATGESRWHEAAANLAAPMVIAEVPSGGTPTATGVATGVGSIVYALTLISRLTGDARGADAARRLARGITEEVLLADPASDVSAGIAGALLALLALHAAGGDDSTLARAAQCGRLLLDRQVPAGAGAAWARPGEAPRAGFAHGAAGIAYALARLFAVTRDPAVASGVAAAHAFERGMFSPADRNWPAGGPNVDDGAVLMTAWCNGAPGVGLARAFAATIFEDAALAGEVGVAVESSTRLAAAQADPLCCGNMGRADVLFTIGELLPSQDTMRLGMQIAGSVVRRARQRGHFRLSAAGAEYEVFAPGFFTGLSGIGYTLLRFAEPHRLPSVLAFAI